jgi:tRNA threonylcarbamoyl adenosine modification protein YeaZ
MMELALDTSSSTISIAVSQQGKVVNELTWQTKRNHTIELLPGIAYLLGQAGITASSLEAIFVAKGPGSFNGLRVGISTAKGFALALKIPLLGISTLEADAYPFACTGLPLYPVHTAGRGEIATATYQQIGEEWRSLEAEHLTTPEALCQQIEQKSLVCGDFPPEIEEELKLKCGNWITIPEAATRLRRAGALSSLGWEKLSSGRQDNLVTLQPLYLRPPHITKSKKSFSPIATRNING